MPHETPARVQRGGALRNKASGATGSYELAYGDSVKKNLAFRLQLPQDNGEQTAELAAGEGRGGVSLGNKRHRPSWRLNL